MCLVTKVLKGRGGGGRNYIERFEAERIWVRSKNQEGGFTGTFWRGMRTKGGGGGVN